MIPRFELRRFQCHDMCDPLWQKGAKVAKTMRTNITYFINLLFLICSHCKATILSCSYSPCWPTNDCKTYFEWQNPTLTKSCVNPFSSFFSTCPLYYRLIKEAVASRWRYAQCWNVYRIKALSLHVLLVSIIIIIIIIIIMNFNRRNAHGNHGSIIHVL